MKENTKRILILAANVLLPVLVILAEFGLIRSLSIGSLRFIVLHMCLIFVFQIGLLLLISFRRSFSAIKTVLFIVISTVIFTALWFLLIGYRLYVAGFACSGAVLFFISLFSMGFRIKWREVVCAGLALVLMTSACLACILPPKIESEKRIKETPLADHSNGFAHANQPKTIYHFTFSTYSSADGIMIKSLQGCLGLISDVQLLIENVLIKDWDSYYRNPSSYPVYRQTIEKFYPDVTIVDITDYSDLLEKVGPLIENYIYCDEDDEQSAMVAFNLCNRFRSVVVGKTYLPYAEKFGWKKVFDTTGKDQNWLMKSTFFDTLDKSFVFATNPFYDTLSYADYAIISGSFLFSRPETISELEWYLKYLDRNFILISGLIEEERGMVAAASRYSGTFVFSSGMANVSVLSGFRPENAVKTNINTDSGVKKKTAPIESSGKGKHTVCIMLSDGDNMRFVAGQGLVSPTFLGSDKRTGESHLTYGMSGMMVLLMPIILLAHYDRMYPTEDYVMQLGSVGYVFPSQWKDDKAFQEVTDLLVQSMEVADTRVVELIDDISFMDITDSITDYNSLRPYFDKYTCYERIDGCLFINFMDLYAGFGGKICWSNDKPVVSARYSIWNNQDNSLASKKNTIEYIADSINCASKDETSEDSYSFVIMHAWSGLDENGNLIPHGDAIAAMNKLVSLLNEDVDVVPAEEFITRINNNVKR